MKIVIACIYLALVVCARGHATSSKFFRLLNIDDSRRRVHRRVVGGGFYIPYSSSRGASSSNFQDWGASTNKLGGGAFSLPRPIEDANSFSLTASNLGTGSYRASASTKGNSGLRNQGDSRPNDGNNFQSWGTARGLSNQGSSGSNYQKLEPLVSHSRGAGASSLPESIAHAEAFSVPVGSSDVGSYRISSTSGGAGAINNQIGIGGVDSSNFQGWDAGVSSLPEPIEGAGSLNRSSISYSAPSTNGLTSGSSIQGDNRIGSHYQKYSGGSSTSSKQGAFVGVSSSSFQRDSARASNVNFQGGNGGGSFQYNSASANDVRYQGDNEIGSGGASNTNNEDFIGGVGGSSFQGWGADVSSLPKPIGGASSLNPSSTSYSTPPTNSLASGSSIQGGNSIGSNYQKYSGGSSTSSKQGGYGGVSGSSFQRNGARTSNVNYQGGNGGGSFQYNSASANDVRYQGDNGIGSGGASNTNNEDFIGGVGGSSFQGWGADVSSLPKPIGGASSLNPSSTSYSTPPTNSLASGSSIQGGNSIGSNYQKYSGGSSTSSKQGGYGGVSGSSFQRNGARTSNVNYQGGNGGGSFQDISASANDVSYQDDNEFGSGGASAINNQDLIGGVRGSSFPSWGSGASSLSKPIGGAGSLNPSTSYSAPSSNGLAGGSSIQGGNRIESNYQRYSGRSSTNSKQGAFVGDSGSSFQRDSARASNVKHQGGNGGGSFQDNSASANDVSHQSDNGVGIGGASATNNEDFIGGVGGSSFQGWGVDASSLPNPIGSASSLNPSSTSYSTPPINGLASGSSIQGGNRIGSNYQRYSGGSNANGIQSAIGGVSGNSYQRTSARVSKINCQRGHGGGNFQDNSASPSDVRYQSGKGVGSLQYNSASASNYQGGYEDGTSQDYSEGSSIHSHYESISQTSEGQNVDPDLLQQIRTILLREEDASGSGYETADHLSSFGASSISYGAPSSAYGAPSTDHSESNRIIGITFEGFDQSILIAEYHQTIPDSSSLGLDSSSSLDIPSGHYGAPH